MQLAIKLPSMIHNKVRMVLGLPCGRAGIGFRRHDVTVFPHLRESANLAYYCGLIPFASGDRRYINSSVRFIHLKENNERRLKENSSPAGARFAFRRWIKAKPGIDAVRGPSNVFAISGIGP